MVRAVLAEWPPVIAAPPTTLLLPGASLGWWRTTGIEDVAFADNTVLLLGWDLLASRAAGHTHGHEPSGPAAATRSWE
ncbi:hypothetical protein ACF09Y_34175 [Streptomyces massasporeus]|uniref:hypothetical protein n=1 Tax=Streptomyces massasporeus TaxID=67324 RepID=UPI0036FF5CCF